MNNNSDEEEKRDEVQDVNLYQHANYNGQVLTLMTRDAYDQRRNNDRNDNPGTHQTVYSSFNPSGRLPGQLRPNSQGTQRISGNRVIYVEDVMANPSNANAIIIRDNTRVPDGGAQYNVIIVTF